MMCNLSEWHNVSMRLKHRLMSLTLSLSLCIMLAITTSLNRVVATSADVEQTLTVFAAASLQDAFTEIAANFSAAHPTASVEFNFGNSATLATQLVEGVVADVFASANERQLEVVRKAGRITDVSRTFARNRLILIVPSDNPAQLTGLRDLARPGLKLVLAAKSAPVREYTNSMLDKMAALPEYGEAYRAAVLNNVVSEETNVRQVAAKVAFGEADAGIVYQSDVTPDLAAQVIAFPIPDDLNTIAAYPIVALADSAEPELAEAFIQYVLSEAGQAVLATWGFVVLTEATPTSSPTPSATPKS